MSDELTQTECFEGLLHIQLEKGYKQSWLRINAEKLCGCDPKDLPDADPVENEQVNEMVAEAIAAFKKTKTIRIPDEIFFNYQREIGLVKSNSTADVQDALLSHMQGVVDAARKARVAAYEASQGGGND